MRQTDTELQLKDTPPSTIPEGASLDLYEITEERFLMNPLSCITQRQAVRETASTWLDNNGKRMLKMYFQALDKTAYFLTYREALESVKSRVLIKKQRKKQELDNIQSQYAELERRISRLK